ncbi:MAG: discoidin domain-containing protein [Terriglobales bacterium]
MSAGTITREWPPSSTTSGGWGPNALTHRYPWRSKSGAPGPYVLVFEFAARAEIDALGFQPWNGWDEKDVPNVAQAVRVEGSTQGPDSGYSTLGDYALQATTKEQDFPLSRPAMARWLRVTLQQRGADYTYLGRVFAYGKLQPPATTNPISGVWLYDSSPHQADD